MMTNTVSRLTANNAAYNWMSSANSLSRLSFSGGNNASLLYKENSLRLGMLNNGLTYKTSLLMDETERKITHDNIERTFNTFG